MSSNNSLHRKTVVINQSLASSATFTIDLGQYAIGFIPKTMIIRQLLYYDITGNNQGTYLIWSSINSTYIGAVYNSIQSVGLQPHTTITMDNSTFITFRVERGNAAFNLPTGQLVMTLEFIDQKI